MFLLVSVSFLFLLLVRYLLSTNYTYIDNDQQKARLARTFTYLLYIIKNDNGSFHSIENVKIKLCQHTSKTTLELFITEIPIKITVEEEEEKKTHKSTISAAD